MEKKDWRERFEKLVVGRGTSDGRIPPITMGEVLLNTPNPEGRKILEDFISKEIEKAEERGRKEVLEELQEDFSEYGVPDDVRYTHPLFYINNIIEKRLEDLTSKD